MRPLGATLTENDILNEARAIDRLCKDRTHKNIVSVFKHGWLSDSLHYFIDMELCDATLESYIYNTGAPKAREMLFVNDNLSSFGLEGDVWLEFNAWSILVQLCDALEFIHHCGQVHRDLKPRNGWPQLLRSVIY
jgi:serine/threonine protein kinase